MYRNSLFALAAALMSLGSFASTIAVIAATTGVASQVL